MLKVYCFVSKHSHIVFDFDAKLFEDRLIKTAHAFVKCKHIFI